MLSAGSQKEKYDVKRDGSYGRVLYNWNRYYDPQLGRYITSDLIGLDGGINTYGYANQNPSKYIDPRGMFNTCAFDTGAYGCDEYYWNQVDVRAVGSNGCFQCVVNCGLGFILPDGLDVAEVGAKKVLQKVAQKTADEFAKMVSA